MKFFKKILPIIIFIFLLFLLLPKGALGSCALPECAYSRSCSPPCDTCPWCPAPPPEGIYNPAISKIFGTGEGADIIARLIANFLKIAFSVAGLVLLAMLLVGGIQWMTAGGDKEKMAKAQGRITAALVGFVIFMSVFAIINFIAPALGLEFLQILEIPWPTP